MLGFYFEMSPALDFGPVHNFCSNWDILKVFRVITFIFEGFFNLLFLKRFSVLHFIWTFLEQNFPLLLQLDSISFFCLFVCGLLLPMLRHPAENQSLPSHYVLGLLAANVKLLPVLSDQSVAAEQMARLSAEVSAQRSQFVTLLKASPSCRAAKMARPVPHCDTHRKHFFSF